MENSKLMTPLFYNGNFNREGHKMRAVFEREISNGTVTYRIWRSARKQNSDYPRAENDKYLLHVEINGYLVPLGKTDFALADQCGFKAAVKKLYGGSEERGQHFGILRKSGGEEAVLAALKAERKEIERCGSDPACQADYIQKFLDGCASAYLEAKENGGKTFPDFYGAAVVNDLAKCAALSALYKTTQREKDFARAAHAAEKDKAIYEQLNREAEQHVLKAIQVIRNGGVLKNGMVIFYRSKYDASSYSIFNYLMRKYQVDVPLRTQGWINEKLVSVSVKDGKCEHLQYYRAKNGRCSQKFFECMNALIRAVAEQTPEQAGEDSAA